MLPLVTARLRPFRAKHNFGKRDASCALAPLCIIETKWPTQALAFPLHEISRCRAFFLSITLRAEDDLKGEIARVAAISNSIERLAAFDALAQRIGAAPGSQVSEESTGRWKIKTEISPVDDSTTLVASLYADEEVTIGYNKKHFPYLIVRYFEGRLQSCVGFDAFLGTGSISATLRFDKDTAQTQDLDISTNHQSGFVRDAAVLAFVRKLATSQSLLVRLTPFSQNPVTVSFSTKGFEKLLPEFEKLAAQKKPKKK